MLRKGRCSNIVDKCSLAKSGTLLPYAGIGSICPECSAPLALVAADEPFTPQEGYAPRNEAPRNDEYNNYAPKRRVREEEYEESSKGLNVAVAAAVFVGVVGLVFFGLKFFDKKQHDDNTATNSTEVSQNGFTVQDVTQTTMLKTSGVVSALKSPDSSEIIANIGDGVALDVTGETYYNNTRYYRVTIPYRQGLIGYVPADRLVPVSQDGLVIEGTGTDASYNQVGAVAPPAAPVLSDVKEMSETILYVNSARANIRGDVGPNAPKVSEALLGDTLTATASRTLDGKPWYRITLPSGGEGWISGTLLSREKPKDPPKASGIKPVEAADASASIDVGSNVMISVEQANLRNDANASSADNIVSKIDKGSIVKVKEVKTDGNTVWLRVQSNALGIDGWVSKSTVKPLN